MKPDDKPENDPANLADSSVTPSPSADLPVTKSVKKKQKKASSVVVKRPRGRPRKNPVGKQSAFQLPTLEQMERYGRLGMTAKQVADALACDYSTVFEMWRIYPQLKVEYLRGKSGGIEEGLEHLWKHIREGHKGSLFFMLERIGGFGAKVDHTLSSSDRPPVDLDPDQQRRMAMAVLDIAEVPRETPALESVAETLAEGRGQIAAESRAEGLQLDREIAEGRAMLKRDKPDGGRIRGDEQAEPEDA